MMKMTSKKMESSPSPILVGLPTVLSQSAENKRIKFILIPLFEFKQIHTQIICVYEHLPQRKHAAGEIQ